MCRPKRKLTIDGEATTSTSTQRVFVSPALETGRDYHYTVKVEFVKEGKVVSVSKEVAVRAGNETRVTLDADEHRRSRQPLTRSRLAAEAHPQR